MEKLSSLANNKFIYLGKEMPLEFAQICKSERFQDKIPTRKDNPTRYFNMVANFLKYDYKGDLPNTVAGVAKVLKYPWHIKDLFYMNEEGYKNVYPKEYADFFQNKPLDEQERIFQATDFGARTLFEYKQDVECGTVVEDMISYHTKGILSRNEQSTAGNDSISTYCDFVFRNPKRPGLDVIEQPIELKTKFGRQLKDDEIVQVRGSIRKILETDGMILAVWVKLNKAVLIDPIGKKYRMEMGKMGNKDCVNIHVPKEDIVDFCFWNLEDVKMMMHRIYDQKKSRNK